MLPTLTPGLTICSVDLLIVTAARDHCHFTVVNGTETNARKEEDANADADDAAVSSEPRRTANEGAARVKNVDSAIKRKENNNHRSQKRKKTTRNGKVCGHGQHTHWSRDVAGEPSCSDHVTYFSEGTTIT